MKPFIVKSSTDVDLNDGNNYEGLKFKVGDHVRISKHANIFAEGCALNWS